jgi:hypothetical protein
MAGESTTAPTSPTPGAPDEQCSPNPDRVYLVEQPFDSIYFTRLTDLGDPSNLCAYYGEIPDEMRLDPQDGSLITLRGDQIWRLRHDWLVPHPHPEVAWSTGSIGAENDEELGRVMYSADITCRGKDPDSPYVLLTDDVNIYASCGGWWFNAPHIQGTGDWPHLVGLVNDRKIFKGPPFTMSGYYTEDPEQVPLVRIGMPGDVDAIEHLAVRPLAGALLAAVQVWRGDVVTTEQARVDANGLTLTGAYAHDIGEAGVPFMDYALAADGTIYGIEIVEFDVDNPVGQRVVQMTMSDPPSVIMTTNVYAEDRPVRLVAVGAGGPTPSY